MPVCKFYSWWDSGVKLTKEEVQDIVDLLFRGDAPFFIYGVMAKDAKKGTRGRHEFLGNCHVVHLDGRAIVQDVSEGLPVGGTIYVPDPRLGTAMVLAHEVQHANQHLDHARADKSFWGNKRSRYMNRASERDARMFADQNMRVLAEILGIPLQREQENFETVGRALKPLWEILTETDEIISRDDLLKEMRVLGIGDERSYAAGLKMFEASGLVEDGPIVNLVEKVV
jgi:hypothetical protein